DADNLSDYQSDSTSTHTNCLIQLLKSGWLRSFVSTEARILQQPHLLSSDYFQKFSKISSTTSTTCASDLSLAGGEFYSVTRCCQHLFFSAFDREDRTVESTRNRHFQLLPGFDELKRPTIETYLTH
ncbi:MULTISPECIES: hypothetical protein, partial [unclassified Pseudomonas]|uniref:hypothetical protein n=1 Tax=unclassified Pseudomonas TaxID=196821 RepID=UPI0021155547